MVLPGYSQHHININIWVTINKYMGEVVNKKSLRKSDINKKNVPI